MANASYAELRKGLDIFQKYSPTGVFTALPAQTTTHILAGIPTNDMREEDLVTLSQQGWVWDSNLTDWKLPVGP